MQNFSDLVQGERFQIQSWLEGVWKMCVFLQKTGHILVFWKWWEI